MNVESFEKLHGFFIEDLKVGQKAILKKKITENEITKKSFVASFLESVRQKMYQGRK